MLVASHGCFACGRQFDQVLVTWQAMMAVFVTLFLEGFHCNPSYGKYAFCPKMSSQGGLAWDCFAG
jgi:hypothetical protein